MENNKLYDIHMHTMDLSHGNMTAFLERLDREGGSDKSDGNLLQKLIGIMALPLKRLVARLMGRKIFTLRKAGQLLSFMESSLDYSYLTLDFYLKNKNKTVNQDNTFSLGDIRFNKIVLCPLIMDFGRGGTNKKYFYHMKPEKPIVKQMEDLFSAIRFYYSHELALRGSNFEVRDFPGNHEDKLFEIYPFMGLNTQNYTIEKIRKMLDKYFSLFTSDQNREERKKLISEGIRNFDGNFESEEKVSIFTGIKLYPPLGFNPWPEQDNDEMAKVCLLYDYCQSRNIPITVHASPGGFRTESRGDDYAFPGGPWAKALEAYPGLKLNFAHFTSNDEEWQKAILKHIKPESRVFTDISCHRGGETMGKLNYLLKGDDSLLPDRFLFGSDFMINLLWYESYNEYLSDFLQTSRLNTDFKIKLARDNPESFLFG